jgi:hypothetical protein
VHDEKLNPLPLHLIIVEIIKYKMFSPYSQVNVVITNLVNITAFGKKPFQLAVFSSSTSMG